MDLHPLPGRERREEREADLEMNGARGRTDETENTDKNDRCAFSRQHHKQKPYRIKKKKEVSKKFFYYLNYKDIFSEKKKSSL
jgi:hypothetical protein